MTQAQVRDVNSKDSQRKDKRPGEKSKKIQRKVTTLVGDGNSKASQRKGLMRNSNSKVDYRKDTVSVVQMST